jgi:hypothetical protein
MEGVVHAWKEREPGRDRARATETETETETENGEWEKRKMYTHLFWLILAVG